MRLAQWVACRRRSSLEISSFQTRSLIAQKVNVSVKELKAWPTKAFFTGIRPFTFFEKGVVGHVGFADPFDEKIAKVGQENTRDVCPKLTLGSRL